MRRIILLAALTVTHVLNAQTILHNPDFEDYNACPTTLNQVERLNHWYAAIHTPDYYNCNFLGFYAMPSFTDSYSGSGFVGIASSILPNGSAEAVAQHLNSPLLPLMNYSLSFAAKIPVYGDLTNNCGGIELFGFNNSQPQATDFIHASDLPDGISLGTSTPITNADWELFQITFTVDDTINYLLITIEYAPGCMQYIFLDNLELKSDISTSLTQLSSSRDFTASSYYNNILVEGDHQINEIYVSDLSGRLIQVSSPNRTRVLLPIEQPGVYVITLTTETGLHSLKVSHVPY